MVFFLECVVACVLFTAALEALAAKRREVFVNDYPPVVTEKLRALGIVAEKPPARKSDIIRKLIAVVVFALVIALALRHFNGITTFSQAALTAYLLWLVVDWYDFLVVDILMAPFDMLHHQVCKYHHQIPYSILSEKREYPNSVPVSHAKRNLPFQSVLCLRVMA